MNRTGIILMLILTTALIVDTITANIYDLISEELASSWGLVFFISNSAIILGTRAATPIRIYQTEK